jgi:hypothetical protein
MLDIPEGFTGRGNPMPPPPPHPTVSIEQLLATQNQLMGALVQNEARRGVECPQHHRHQVMNTSYSDFLATHSPIFFGQMTRWRQMIGSAPPSQSLVYYTSQSTRRLYMPPSS